MFNTSNSQNIVWTVDYSNLTSSDTYYISTSSTSTTTNEVRLVLKKCRNCQHSHVQEDKMGCYEVLSSDIRSVFCFCSQHVPEDNLEYLEYLVHKKESL